MAIGDIKTFDIVYLGLKLEVNAIDLGDGTVRFAVKALEGSADINALYWNDGDNTANEGKQTGFDAKKDSSLNMNGSGEAWDGGHKLSSTGLGKEGANKATYLQAGTSHDSVFQDATVRFDDITTLGIRATSTSTAEGSIKGVDDGVVTLAPVVCVEDAAPVIEGGKSSFEIHLDQAYLYDVTVSYTTVVGTAGTADYQEATASVLIKAGDLSAKVEVQTTDDAEVESDETFTLHLTGVSIDIPGNDIASPTFIECEDAVGKILDNDTSGGGGNPPADDNFPEFNGLSHVTLYFKAGAEGVLGADTKGAGKAPDGWFTVKFETGQLPKDTFDLDDELEGFLDLLVGAGKITDDGKDSLCGVSLHDGTLKDEPGNIEMNLWYDLDGDTTPDPVPSEIEALWPVLASSVDLTYNWSGSSWTV